MQLSDDTALQRLFKQPNRMDGVCIGSLLHKNSHALLFHVSAALDATECQFGLFFATPLGRKVYLKFMNTAVARNAGKQNKLCNFEKDMKPVFEMFHKQMPKCLKKMDTRNRQTRSSSEMKRILSIRWKALLH